MFTCEGTGQVHWTKTKKVAKHKRISHEKTEEKYFEFAQSLLEAGLQNEKFEFFTHHKLVFILDGVEEETKLEPGKHEFRFTFSLAENLPTSFEGFHG